MRAITEPLLKTQQSVLARGLDKAWANGDMHYDQYVDEIVKVRASYQ